MSTAATPTATASTLLSELKQSFPDLDQLRNDLQASEAELRELSTSPQFDANLQLTLRLAAIHLQLVLAKFSDTALSALTRILDCDKPEVVRRSACTILQLAGLLGPKNTAPKPWQTPNRDLGVPQMVPPPALNPISENDITKQHLPTYNDLPIPESSPSAGTPASRRPAPAETPSPSTTPQRHHNPISEFSLQNSALKKNITKQHMPTYSNSTPPHSRPKKPLPQTPSPFIATVLQQPLPSYHEVLHPQTKYHQALTALFPVSS